MEALGINDRGEIAGFGRLSNGEHRPFLLRPCCGAGKQCDRAHPDGGEHGFLLYSAGCLNLRYLCCGQHRRLRGSAALYSAQSHCLGAATTVVAYRELTLTSAA